MILISQIGFRNASQLHSLAKEKKKFLLQPPGFPEVPGLLASLVLSCCGLETPVYTEAAKNLSDRLKISHRMPAANGTVGSLGGFGLLEPAGCHSLSRTPFSSPLLSEEFEPLLFIAVKKDDLDGSNWP